MDRGRRPIHHPVKAALGTSSQHVPNCPPNPCKGTGFSITATNMSTMGTKMPNVLRNCASREVVFIILSLRHLTTWSSRLSAPSCIGHATSVVSEATECPCMTISAKLRARRFHACPEDPDLCRLCQLCRLCRSRPDTNSGVDAS